MKRKAIAVFSGSLLVGAMAAQQVTVTASAPVAGSVSTQSAGTSTSFPIPVGPVAAGTIAATSGASSAASVQWNPSVPNQLAPAAFRVFAIASASISTAVGGCLFALDIHLDNGGSGALTGVLQLRLLLTQVGAMANATVDVGNDGSIELAGADGLRTIAVHEPGGSLDVRIVAFVVAGGFFGMTYANHGVVDVSGEFFPGRTIVDRFDTFGSAVSLDAAPIGSDRWQLGTSSLPSLNLQPFATVFGLQPANVPIANGLTQLVSLDAWLPGTSLVFDLPPLPPGFAMYAQGLVTAPDGTLLSSNSVRALWF